MSEEHFINLVFDLLKSSHLPTHMIDKVKIEGLSFDNDIDIEAVILSIIFAPITFCEEKYEFNIYKSACSIIILLHTAYVKFDMRKLIYNEYMENLFLLWLCGKDPLLNGRYIMRENERARLIYYIYSFSDICNRTACKELYKYLIN